MSAKVKPLSKTALMSSLQCNKKLWLSMHRKDLEAKVDAATQMQFDEGNEVGELAREHFGKGELIDFDYWEYQKAHDRTQELIKSGAKVIYEASFLVDGLFARADILEKDKNGWNMIEVKKSTQVKGYHFNDAAIQTHIVELSGLKLKSISIMHINNEVVYPEIDDLFVTEDITKEVRALKKEVGEIIRKARSVAVAKNEPKVKIGPHCDDPFDCPFKDYCWQKIPEKSVFDLPGLRIDKKWDLFDSGLEAIKDLDSSDYKGNTKRAIEVTKTNKTFSDKKTIARELDQWAWPLYFFDYETIGPAIPRYDGTTPYGQVPFQFSCHVWIKPSAESLEHFEYLHQKSSDPRDGIIAAMIKGLGSKGSIVAYNKAFEIGVIKKLAEYDKKNRKTLLALIDRFVDPLPIFRSSVYHPDFLGSFSIKNVAPALIGKKLSYEDLEIGDGSSAQAAAEMILRGRISGGDLEKAVDNLLKYCRQDTMAMVEIVKWLMAQK
jgi:CRISPR/Cas system-associated exonuclease Cas4 (RecB family)